MSDIVNSSILSTSQDDGLLVLIHYSELGLAADYSYYDRNYRHGYVTINSHYS